MSPFRERSKKVYRSLRCFCRKSLQLIGRMDRDTKIFFRQIFFGIKIAWICSLKKETPKRVFFILCQCRTGSSLLVSYFNSIPGVFCGDEILSSVKPYGIRRWWVSETMALRHIRNTFNYRDEKVCGAKIIFDHLKQLNLSLDDLVSEFPEAHCIVLYRRNILEQFLSQKIADQTRVWARYENSPPPDDIQIHFSLEEAKQFRDWMKSYYQNAWETLRPRGRSLWISYEELAKDSQGLFDEKIFPFLELPRHKVSTDMLKQNRRMVSQIISNYNEARDMIEQTDFSHGDSFAGNVSEVKKEK